MRFALSREQYDFAASIDAALGPPTFPAWFAPGPRG